MVGQPHDRALPQDLGHRTLDRLAGLFVLDPKDLLARPDVLLRGAVAAEAPLHPERILLPDEGQSVDAAVAGGAVDALGDVDAVADVAERAELVDALQPGDDALAEPAPYGRGEDTPVDPGVLSVVIDAPPMNLIGPELVRDLVTLLGELETGQETRVVVLASADPEYFVPHVDLTKVAEAAEDLLVFWVVDPRDHLRHLEQVLSQLRDHEVVLIVARRRDQDIRTGNARLLKDGNLTPHPALPGGRATKIPLIVLVNKGTASASEIVAGAIRDHGRGILVGEKTFGTGTVLEEFSLSDGSAILLGTHEWLTPDGHFIRDLGISPNIQVKLNSNVSPLTPTDENSSNMSEQQILSSGDVQLAAAIHYLEKH